MLDKSIKIYEPQGKQIANVVLIDNYDSFTYNLVQAFCMLGARVSVGLNDQISLDEILAPQYSHIVISPGPGHPNKSKDFGIGHQLLMALPVRKPILGVCLGFQGLAAHFGAQVRRAPKVMHGKTSMITHHQQGLFQELPNPLSVMRYHSLCVDAKSLPACLEAAAFSDDDQVLMAFKHREWPIYGVQFHPESVGSPLGPKVLANFLRVKPYSPEDTL